MFPSLQDDKIFYGYDQTQFCLFRDYITKVSYSPDSLDEDVDIEKINYVLRIRQQQNQKSSCSEFNHLKI